MRRGRAVASALVITAILASGTAACTAGSQPQPSTIGGSAAAIPNGATVDAAGFTAALAVPGTVILDVRTPQEFASGHLRGAQNIDIGAADFGERIGALRKDVPYAVYCRSGNRSGQALAQMVKLGFTKTYHLGGGIGAWTASGGQVVTGS